MRIVTRKAFTARELREQSPDGFRRAHDRHVRWTCEDPAWLEEHRQSLDAVLCAVGEEPPKIDGPTRAHDIRRCMAWLENNVMEPLRMPWVGIGWRTPAADRRRRMSRYGADYRPGSVPPCPFTGYFVDDDLLRSLMEAARDGRSPHEWPRLLRDVAERLWEHDIQSQCSESSFVKDAEANGREFYEDGELV